MSARFTLAMARRESRSTRRRLALYIVAVTLGVAALVAISSFRANVISAVTDQARALLGADLVLGSRWEFEDDVLAVIDSLEAEGAEVAWMRSFTSMALATGSGMTRLVEVQSPTGDYPFYGQITTEPPGAWDTFREARRALVDPAVLVQLDAEIGDTLAIGRARFVIEGTVTGVPGDIGLRSAFSPRVYIPSDYLDDTELLRFGSISVRQAYIQLEEPQAAERLIEEKDSLLEANRVWSTTVDEYEDDLTEGLDDMGAFLALVGLVALLLGGVGVASGVHVFVSDKLDTAAVLRCIGARQWQTFAIYLLQAGLMGLVGATVGVALGLGVQAALPIVLRDFLPLDVPFDPVPSAILAGFGIGVWVALLFAFLPLLKIKDVAPLRALRRDYESRRRRRDPWRLSTYAAIGLTLLALTLWQAPAPAIGFGFAGAAVVTAAALGFTAWALMKLTRRFFPARARFALRQGIANLFRPHNQTAAITLAIGSGVFLIALVYVVQRNLLDQITMETRPDRPNLLMFDVQPDQRAGLQDLLTERGAPILQQAPIVPAQLVQVGDRSVEEILADTTGRRIPRWALLRQYRHTYRDSLVGSEELVAGSWFGESAEDAGGVARVSIEEEIAEDLRVGIGDRLTWNVQGVAVETEIVNVRRVDWARFEPNFFFVFEPGALENAPQSLVMLTRVDDPVARAEIQRDMVQRFPNVAAIDLTVIIQAIDTILGKVAVAIRFMALFSIAAGAVILIGAIATSRYQRARESVLLKTLGARSRIIARILATEYFALGSFAGLAGVALAAIGGWAAVVFLFELDFQLPALPLVLIWIATAVLTAAIGMANSRDVLRRTPLAGMRDFAE
ncbi:MAG: FtsX-like permease family protein [Gemmatimonadetes bacterium]|uniref:FtsX-like permease family protein n=1 Tax=Candidatus Kutchimonas denitrificans TaxID=3056748 RepID=A0AAE4Z882_9BACT|nr:FtsX-like permease family protein [Gemmatimonadota bacterium]NIR73986.1 FtsX-like permease family protein [Candidatus Kutchimonas denitrificans]NIS02975.1 FtsX-like permease family protein [Gemmatimonadota bacterium]NIT68692.1 FtsX-like permease family protein [Gemmatimonadota bacterium]NIU53273.1 FtsX-like permease family protein [Gemmatimonadota bacterium]